MKKVEIRFHPGLTKLDLLHGLDDAKEVLLGIHLDNHSDLDMALRNEKNHTVGVLYVR